MFILRVLSLSPPAPTKVNLSDAHLYTTLTLSRITPLLNYTASPEADAYSAARANVLHGPTFLLRLYAADFATFHAGGTVLFRNFVTLPFLFATLLRQQVDIPGLEGVQEG
jgi:hypothetical protein